MYIVSSFLSKYRVYKFPNTQTNFQASMLHSSFREAKQGGSLTFFEEEEQVLRLAFFQWLIVNMKKKAFSFMTNLYTLLQSFHLYDVSKWHVGDFFSIPASYSQGLQLYNISEDPTESWNLVRWMNPARLVYRNLFLPNKLWCFCQYANFDC